MKILLEIIGVGFLVLGGLEGLFFWVVFKRRPHDGD